MSSDVKIERPGSLALSPSKQKSRVTFQKSSVQSCNNKDKSNNDQPFKKFRSDPDFRRRKRTSSCSFSWDKRRRPTIILPTKFLLGGNIGDPLNLEALNEEEGEAEKKENDHSSNNYRGGGVVRVIIPPNINDPLNLDACSDEGEEQLTDAIHRQRRRRKTKKRKRRNSEPGGVSTLHKEEKRLSLPSAEKIIEFDEIKGPTPKESTEIPSNDTLIGPPLLRQLSCPVLPHNSRTPTTTTAAVAKPTSLPGKSRIASKKVRPKPEDKIVSPVIPQPGAERKRHSSNININMNKQKLKPPKTFNPRSQKFRYGNYNQYYGYRNPDHAVDPRLKYIKKDWIENKTVLDIGCNIGHIALSLARDFNPKRVIGVDIDKKLINIAKKNIKYYIDEGAPPEESFPKSMKLLYGPIKGPLSKEGAREFPFNVSFAQSNYVLEDDALLETVRPEFDVILCLSVTKWVHLNWGDTGIKRFFKRIFNNLRPGGLLILEPQPWPSYNRRRKLTLDIFENYIKIELFPKKFGDFLTKEVGFISEEKIRVFHHFSKGFQRPIFLYRKKSDTDASKVPPALDKLTAQKAIIECKESNKSPPDAVFSTDDVAILKTTSIKDDSIPTTSNEANNNNCADSERTLNTESYEQNPKKKIKLE